MNPDLKPPARCPRCGAAINSTVTTTKGGVVEATSLCTNGCPSFQKWLA